MHCVVSECILLPAELSWAELSCWMLRHYASATSFPLPLSASWKLSTMRFKVLAFLQAGLLKFEKWKMCMKGKHTTSCRVPKTAMTYEYFYDWAPRCLWPNSSGVMVPVIHACRAGSVCLDAVSQRWPLFFFFFFPFLKKVGDWIAFVCFVFLPPLWLRLRLITI